MYAHCNLAKQVDTLSVSEFMYALLPFSISFLRNPTQQLHSFLLIHVSPVSFSDLSLSLSLSLSLARQLDSVFAQRFYLMEWRVEVPFFGSNNLTTNYEKSSGAQPRARV